MLSLSLSLSLYIYTANTSKIVVSVSVCSVITWELQVLQKTLDQIWTPQVLDIVISHVAGLWYHLGESKLRRPAI